MNRRPLAGRLSVRLVGAVGLALTPLAVLAYVQAKQLQDASQARAEAALFGETLLAATPQVEAVRRAQGVAATLALTVGEALDDPAACSRIMAEVVDREPNVSLAAYFDRAGTTTCSSTGKVIEVADRAGYAGLLAAGRPVVRVDPRGRISGESVLGLWEPVSGAGGTLRGFVTVSVPHRALEPLRQSGHESAEDPLALVTFDRDGQILTSFYGLESVADRLPAGVNLAGLAGRGPLTFRGETPGGAARTFAIVPMLDDSLFVLSAWPAAAWGGFLPWNIPLWVFPAAMWLASLLIAWLASEYQMLRHIRALRRAIIAFSRGSRTVVPPRLAGAPAELRDVGDAYERMVESVLHDEAELEDTIHQKEVLLREVHHRVKNNLQLIASIMNIQMRKATSPETRGIIKGLHDRVMSLATVHRELYQTSGLTDVRADELMAMIVSQVLRMGTVPGRAITLETAFEPLRLTPDQAVPLSLILTEALTNALKHGGRDAEGKVTLAVTLARAGEGRAVLSVANSLPDRELTHPPGPDISGLGEQLLSAFAMQLGGQLVAGTDAEQARFVLRVEFPLRALTEAEERFVPAD